MRIKVLMLVCTMLPVFLLSACITVPPEVVTLSTTSTSDTRKLHDAYRSLVRKHFATLRQLREQQFADRVLGPYVERAIENGRAVDVFAGKVVWNDSEGKFVEPDPRRAAVQKLDTLNTWYRQVASDIEALRASAFEDLDSLEKDVVDQVDQAFGRVITAGATINAYLLSIQKVQGAQQDFLKHIGLEDLPQKINDALGEASEKAKKWSEEIDNAEKHVTGAKKKLKRIGGQ